jgi:transposase-like protein
VLANSQAKTLEAFTRATTAPGAIVHTDGLNSYAGLAKLGFQHRPRKQTGAAPADQLLPRVHRAISNLKAWMHGTHRGVSNEHLPVYLDEFVFRHNRRGTPMAAFQTLLGLAAIHDPTTYDEIAALRQAA